ncbi:hypothetical protein LTR84_006926 [Exophiala bonariae]|uniref:Xylanolytic transcriptional activator regulatory domain-containing protein n=1 Tax=Exophiala bonariae TaxID=1690606 RepID=A0AAV9MZ43_9EURO|nr:hypothetical protein LTR84_006926 [Exophiala bonariae]
MGLIQVQFPSPAATDYVEGRSRTIPVESPNGQYSPLEQQGFTILKYNAPSNPAQQRSDLEDISMATPDAACAHIAATSLGSQIPNPVGDSMIDFENLQFDDESFLEDILLCQFSYNPPVLTVASSPVPEIAPTIGLPELPDSIAPLEISHPPNDAGQKSNGNPNCAIQITSNELEVFHAKLLISDVDGTLSNFHKPSLSRTLRCMIAYFQHFDPHAPFVHYASFSISTEHPALVLIMLAIGAVHLSETEFARSAYEASCLLLAQHEKDCLEQQDSSFNLWAAQATLLCAQYGVTSGSHDLFFQAQKHLFATHMGSLLDVRGFCDMLQP